MGMLYFGHDNVSNSVTSCTFMQIYPTSANVTGTLIYAFDISRYIPKNAEIISVYGTVRGRKGTSTFIRAQLYAGNTPKSNEVAITSTAATSQSTYTVSGGTWTREDVENIKLVITCQANSTSKYGVYGGFTLSVTYSVLGIVYDLTTECTAQGVSGSSTYSAFLYEGQDVEIGFAPGDVPLSAITVIDNGVDITNQFTFISGYTGTTGEKRITNQKARTMPSHYTSNGICTVAYNDTASTTAAQLQLDYDFDYTKYGFLPDLYLPSYAKIDSVVGKLKVTANGGTFNLTRNYVQMYSGNIPKGSQYKFSATGNTVIVTLDDGEWTADEVKDLNLSIYGVKTATNTPYYAVYGGTVEITYTVPDAYTYTLQNIQEDHEIIIRGPEALYVKVNGTWTQLSNAYRKENGVWVLKGTLRDLFSDGNVYMNE